MDRSAAMAVGCNALLDSQLAAARKACFWVSTGGTPQLMPTAEYKRLLTAVDDEDMSGWESPQGEDERSG